MHQLVTNAPVVVLSTGRIAFFHLASDAVHHSPFFSLLTNVFFVCLFVLRRFFLGPDLTHTLLTFLSS
jgi:hypothetical protein